MSMRALLKGTAVLAGLAGLATLLLHFAAQSTQADRQRNNEIYASRLLSEVLPPGPYDAPPGLTSLPIHDPELLGTDAVLNAYPVYRNGQIATVIVTVVAPDGYVAPLQLLVGMNPDGTITGVRAAKHRETPGLGDKIEVSKSDWITMFKGIGADDTAASNWALRRDGGEFDHISGATITSRAVVNAVGGARNYLSKNRDTLLSTPNASAD